MSHKSDDFSNFLTVSRKYGFSCLYVFRTIYPGRQSWEMIMSQTHIFNFFSGSVHSSRILKTPSLFASRPKNSYLPNQQVGLNKLCFQISNSKEKKCLMIGTRDVNDLGLENLEHLLTTAKWKPVILMETKVTLILMFFQSKRILPKEQIRFSIVKSNFICFELVNKSLDIELKNSLSNSSRSNQQTAKIDSIKNFNNGRSEQVNFSTRRTEPGAAILQQRGGHKRRGEHNRKKSTKKKQNFSQAADKIFHRHKIKCTATRIKYSPTRIKSRNFLSNISFTGINKNDFYNENFILDVYVLLIKNLNPFSLGRKISDKLKHEMVYMLWRECTPSDFYRYICEEKNFVYLNDRNVEQPGALEIVGNFIDQGKQNLRMLQESLARYKDIFQYVYSHVFPEVYTASEKGGFDLKSNFHIIFKAYRDKMAIKQDQLAKNPSNYASSAIDQKETFEFEQKPIESFNEFSDAEEAELKKKKSRNSIC